MKRKKILIIITILLAILLNSCSDKNPNEPNQEENQLKLYITPANQSINLEEEANYEVKIDELVKKDTSFFSSNLS